MLIGVLMKSEEIEKKDPIKNIMMVSKNINTQPL
jgi:hypothetical protein